MAVLVPILLIAAALLAPEILQASPLPETPETRGPQPPSGNLRIDSGSGPSGSPALAAEPGGRAHAVWHDNSTGSFGIHYSRSTDFGATWEADRRLDPPVPGSRSFEADVAVDLTGGSYNGSVYVVWRTSASGGGDVWILRSPDGGVTWTSPMVLDAAPTTATATHPSVAVGRGGGVFVVWSDSRDSVFQVFLRSSTDGGATWSPEIVIGAPGLSNILPTVAASSEGIYVSWLETDPFSRVSIPVATSSDGGQTWQTRSAVPQGLMQTFDIGVDPAGALHLVWVDIGTGGAQSLRYIASGDLGLSFSAPVTVAAAPPGTQLKESRIAILGPVAAVTWSAQTAGSSGSDFDIYTAWSTGDGWSAPVRVDDTDRNANPSDDDSAQDRPAVAGAGTTLHFAWTDSRSVSYTDIYASAVEWDQVLITEVQDSPEGQEFVELYGWSRQATSLVGWSLDIDGARFDLSGLGSLGPGALVTVGEAPMATLRMSIDLNDEGALVQVLDSSYAVVDAIGFGQRGSPPDPHPSESTSRLWRGASYGRTWSWSPAPSPGSPNQVAPPMLGPPVVLNEVRFHSTNPDGAFIGLYYRANVSATARGLTLVGDSRYSLPDISFSPAQPHYFVFAPAGPALFSSLDVAGDNVYLSDASGRLWDEVGWSSPHQPDRSMTRTSDGVGAHDAFDDASAVAAGWEFDVGVTLPGVRIGPDQNGLGDLGEAVGYVLTVTNELRTPEDIEIAALSSPTGWAVNLLADDGVTPLQDSNQNGIPDLAGLGPLESRNIVVVVHVPSIAPVGDTETTEVTAYAFSLDLVRASAVLLTATVPHIEPLKWATPTTIYVEGSPPPLLTETAVHLEIRGSGQAIERRLPQDTIFVIDSSGSMTQSPYFSDPSGLRIDAIKAYLDGMDPLDRAAIVGFARDSDYGNDVGAWLVNDIGGGVPAHLTRMDDAGKILMKSNAETMRFGLGGTNIEKALQIAHQELLPSYTPTPACRDYARPFPAPPAGGAPGSTWVEILLTDGLPSHALWCTDDEVNVASANGIRIFTIGLGGFVDRTYLEDIATRTGGKYYEATTAEDLLAVYDEISTFVSRIAGYDGDVTDDLPMVTDVLPDFVNVIPGSFRDPVTGASRPPDWQESMLGRTVLQWNVSSLDIGESWSVEYRVSSSQVGTVPLTRYPEARVTYLRWDGLPVSLSFPRVDIMVLAPPPPRVTYTIARDPSRGDVIVDGVRLPAPATFSWTPGEVHDISVPIADLFSPSERDLFDRWDDGGGQAHQVAVGSWDRQITALFVTQFRPYVELIGTSPAHTVRAQYTFHRLPASTSGVSATWSDWVDAGAALAFDSLASGSGPLERWISTEDFAAPPWDPVASGFIETVVYYHQALATIRTSGLAPAARAEVSGVAFGIPVAVRTADLWSGWVDVGSPLAIENPVPVSSVERYASLDRDEWVVTAPLDALVRYYRQWTVRVIHVGLREDAPATLRAVRFGGDVGAAPWAEWSDWVDHGGLVSTSGIVMVGPRERYVTGDTAQWPITSAATLTVRYVHEFRPAVALVGTDAGHTVSVTVLRGGRPVVTEGLRDAWTDWVEAGTRIEFSSATTGSPPRLALDPTLLHAGSAFDATIRYAPQEANLKPWISLLYVVAMLAVAAAVAHRRPLDVYLLPSAARRLSGTGGGPARFRILKTEDKFAKVRKDRRITFLAVGIPFAAAEGMIGLLSLLTGLLRVPEAGNWLCLGLIVNTILLGSSIAVDAIAHRRGYRPRLPKAGEGSRGAPAAKGVARTGR